MDGLTRIKPQLVSVEDAAIYLSMSPKTLRKNGFVGGAFLQYGSVERFVYGSMIWIA